ncbi:MAG: pyridoxal-phosphate dependent enzyme [Armatimonadota bacterium]|nr:pyridoxal-phosphate dependent enzyme [Armatimonadota bacterium]MDR7519489.1 pyridoxal-phosphate dependent enzyme [Armatimonadota bacterium]MDR7549046.1 pyridoxal-phosphate dependent enzyme [Armatimonadota bacterium]
MTRVLDPSRVRFPAGHEAQPFIHYRHLLYAYHAARARGLPDEAFVRLVEDLDRRVAQVDGHGFAVTPFFRSEGLSAHLGFAPGGGVWVKDETGNVSGSHKARHLMGLLILLDVAERTGAAPWTADARPPLAIASCGNAALAAAVVARAGGWPLEVFIPTWAEPQVVARLEALGARLVVCPRTDGVPGDPTYRRLKEALAAGALPFTCQGPDNGLTIEGGMTLGYEMVSALAASGRALDRVFLQVGGGALASSTIQAYQDARRLDALAALPRVHAVQTRGGHPLARAYDLVRRRLLEAIEREFGARPAPGDGPQAQADLIRVHADSRAVQEALHYAATHRSEFMWPWEEEPKSVASGILDDETYDWLAIVKGMVATGGFPVVVSEETLEEANALAQAATGIDVDHTGSAGLAGLLDLHRQGAVGPNENVAVLFTGIKR